MDTSETYIKMMVKAPEIWNTWQYRIGDYVVFRDVGRLDQPVRVRLISHVDNAGTIFLLGDHEFQSYPSNKFYPIPRQDQLQEMVIGRVFGGASALIDWAFSWRETIWNEYPYESMEQFCLTIWFNKFIRRIIPMKKLRSLIHAVIYVRHSFNSIVYQCHCVHKFTSSSFPYPPFIIIPDFLYKHKPELFH